MVVNITPGLCKGCYQTCQLFYFSEHQTNSTVILPHSSTAQYTIIYCLISRSSSALIHFSTNFTTIKYVWAGWILLQECFMQLTVKE